MMRARAVLTGAVAAIAGTVLLMAVLGLVQEPDSGPGLSAGVLSWGLGTAVRACGGYLAARMSLRTGSPPRVAGAGALAGAAGYTAFLALMAGLAGLGGHAGISGGDLIGLPVWTLQAAVGGGLAAVLHRARIASAARTSPWSYGG
ncbi:hypothetical protein [Actinomadura violacea]|uniref:Uncharacterized protein n=1 Tax=Actinomadura violacea TaxID=2819934 RepID=A0ABS3RQM9_9ACTN|nr:hypothetical protein [Actinomadura violacea]MBO2458853.1 hypothetical protein [Actinomadura violacea]